MRVYVILSPTEELLGVRLTLPQASRAALAHAKQAYLSDHDDSPDLAQVAQVAAALYTDIRRKTEHSCWITVYRLADEGTSPLPYTTYGFLFFDLFAPLKDYA